MKKFFKSQLSPIKDIEKRNKAFAALSPEDKRKEIAWDSLQLIIMGTISGSCGSYWSKSLYQYLPSSINEQYYVSDSRPNATKTSKELQKKLLEVKECSVCARGSMMLSMIRLGNSIAPNRKDRNDIVSGNSSLLKNKGFSLSQFEDMEAEYEYHTSETPYKRNSTEKLANMCCNIIANDHFDSTDKTDYLTKYAITIPA